jgi:hypothetical protein
MSEAASERGEIKIPRAEWVRLKRGLIQAWNLLLEDRFELAGKLHRHLVSRGKGKRGFDYAAEARTWADLQKRRIVARGARDSVSLDTEAPVEAIALVLRTIPGKRLKPRTVPKKSLPWARPATTREFSSHKFFRWRGHVQAAR